ncbi:MmcQ/YjbR family DNA-binding protein [Nonomuraea sp. K274]|uniref:MmcQ/YjbR family DNA-binding protein n=1 Tax=Nonomuraea cypriaca TaxID=1187855 RepID=A0A931AMZ4_9ACTN|nr:MmcQ/YjbR family DNA-binding protein [Nonomuraea cypriaca]MBF8193364.1 MmcQ/YjbR family DNA-binding protein [Nonomuraea cypriaca]
MATAQELYDDLVTEHLARPEVSMGRMFHAEGLKVNGKVYAFFSRDRDRPVVKLPAARAGELVREGTAELMRMGGRRMREWVQLGEPDEEAWRRLMTEASAYVEALTR